MALVLLTFLNCYMSTLRLVQYALLLTPACYESSNTNTRLVAFSLSLALDPTFVIHSHKTLDTAQPCHLFKPNWKPSSSHSISAATSISTQFLLQSVCVACSYTCNTAAKHQETRFTFWLQLLYLQNNHNTAAKRYRRTSKYTVTQYFILQWHQLTGNWSTSATSRRKAVFILYL